MSFRSGLGALILAVLLIGALLMGPIGVRGQAVSPDDKANFLSASETSHPVAGGRAYFYVLDQSRDVLSVFEDGALVASHKLPEQQGWYSLTTGRSEPVVGGHAYAYALDQYGGIVHFFEDADYLSSEELPETGQPIF